MISFIKNFIQQKQNEVDLSIKYDATHNNLKLNEVNFDTNYFKYFHIKKIDKNKIFLPYYCYPKSKKDDFPKKIKKSIPIVFSGSVNINWYDKFYWKHYNGKRMLSRNEILNYIVDNFRESVFFAKSFKSIQYADDKKIILFLNKNMKSKQKSILKNFEHLRIISMANFFLTAPGTEMPLCHHLIESIKLKTIPITNYGHYLNPKLSKKNSIDFQSFEQLDFAIKKAIKLKSKDIVNMQASLTSYYNNYLSEDSFLRRFNSIKTPFSIISNNDHDSVRLFKKNFSKLF